jgi:HipA N-terminal domain
MPLAAKEHSCSVVEAYLWGLLPDNEQVLARWATKFQVSARNVFALISDVGEDCAGAVQFVTPERLDALRLHDCGVSPLSSGGELDHILDGFVGAVRRGDRWFPGDCWAGVEDRGGDGSGWFGSGPHSRLWKNRKSSAT